MPQGPPPLEKGAVCTAALFGNGAMDPHTQLAGHKAPSTLPVFAVIHGVTSSDSAPPGTVERERGNDTRYQIGEDHL